MKVFYALYINFHSFIHTSLPSCLEGRPGWSLGGGVAKEGHLLISIVYNWGAAEVLDLKTFFNRCVLLVTVLHCQGALKEGCRVGVEGGGSSNVHNLGTQQRFSTLGSS